MKKNRIATLAVLAVITLFALVGCAFATLNMSIDTLQSDTDKTAARTLTGSTWNLAYKPSLGETENYTAKFSSDGSVTLTFIPASAESSETGSLDATAFKIINGIYYLGGPSTTSSPTEYQKYSVGFDGTLTLGERKFTAVGTTNGIRGHWTCTDTGSVTTTKYDLVIGSNNYETLAETTVNAGIGSATTYSITLESYGLDTEAGIIVTTENTTYDGWSAATAEDGTITLSRTLATITLSK